MKISYSLWDPSGNLTVLVETPVAAGERAAVAARLMALEPSAEQVGFLGAGSAPGTDVALRMAGGEFCGNATMSAAVWALEHAASADGGKAAVRVDAGGASEPVAVECAPAEGGARRCSLQMPAPTAVTAVDLPRPGSETVRLPIVHFDGISHLIVERSGTLTPEERADAERLVRDWCEHLNVDGLGLLFLDRAAGRLTPLVYIPGAGTLCWENACGSGTCAVGAWLAAETGAPVSLALRQPGGTLSVTASPAGPVTLTGTVRVLAKKTASLTD